MLQIPSRPGRFGVAGERRVRGTERGGQRQRIAIAHAVLKNPTVLVLDRGQIVEEGARADLLRRNGVYERLPQIQRRDGEDITAALARQRGETREGGSEANATTLEPKDPNPGRG